MRDLFEMTRRERRGTIVVLALIAVLLAATVAVRSCRPAQQIYFPTEELMITDTTTTPVPDKSGRPAKHAKTKKHYPKSPKKSKPSPEPRRLDPVPQF